MREDYDACDVVTYYLFGFTAISKLKVSFLKIADYSGNAYNEGTLPLALKTENNPQARKKLIANKISIVVISWLAVNLLCKLFFILIILDILIHFVEKFPS